MPSVTNEMALVQLGWRDYKKTTGLAGVAASLAPSAISAASLTKSGTTATFTATAAHRLISGQLVTIAGASDYRYNGVVRITVISSTEFTYTLPSTPSADASGTITAMYDAHAQEALVIVPSGGSTITIGPNIEADTYAVAAGESFRIPMPNGAKTDLAWWYAKSASGSSNYTVLFL